VADRVALQAPLVDRARKAVERGLARGRPGGRMLPGYLIIGAKRGGSTSLHEYLLAHPDVLSPLVTKGSRYFDVHHDRGWAWYRSQFPSQRTADRHRRRTGTVPIVGEASPYYLFHPAAPARIAAALPDVRLLAVLRDPVERAWSHHRYEVARGFEHLDFEAALDAEPDRLAGEEDRLLADPRYVSHAHRHFSYLARSRYAEQLERLFDHVPPTRVKVVWSEHLFADPDAALGEVCRFLGLDPMQASDHRAVKANAPATIPAPVAARLRAYFAPHDGRLSALLGMPCPWPTA
jgi:hypothetical protein